MSLGHICLEVSDLDKAKGFYVPLLEKLGFKVILGDKDSVGVSNGAFAIWLTRVESKRVERKPPIGEEFVVTDHFALLVENRKTVNEVAVFMGIPDSNHYSLPRNTPNSERATIQPLSVTTTTM